MVKTQSGYEIFFAPGNFDPWCVYIQHAPLDKEYFLWIKKLAQKYGRDYVYNDFVTVYRDVTENFSSSQCLKICEKVDEHYEEDTTHWWVIFYMTMVAECKKDNAILKKRIKHLGVYNVLIDEWDIDYVVEYMKGKDYRFLDKLMKERGI